MIDSNENLSDKNIYVEQVWLNDTLLDRTYITFEEVLNGGVLRFKMTDKDIVSVNG